MWSEDDVVEVKKAIPIEKQRELSHTLYGKLYSKPNVNFQAFLSTMKRAWKSESVVCNKK